MIIGWPPVEKTPGDVLTVSLDWTPFLALTQNATSITAHSVAADSELTDDPGFGDADFVSIGTAGVIAADNGVTGMQHGVTLSGGSFRAYSIVSLTATFNDGTVLTRSFQVNVR